MLRGFLTSVALFAAASAPLTASADAPKNMLETVNVGPLKAEHAQAATILYFNRCRGGCSVTKAVDNDVRTRSSTIPGGNVGAQYTLTEFMHGDTVWNDMMQCLKEVYSPYNVTITDVQPMPGVPYNENIVAGLSTEIMYSAAAGGVSPVTGDCSPFSYVISYSFANGYGPKPYELCYVAAQETGHSFGMADHSFSFMSDGRSACSDPMSYRADCLSNGQRFFRNEAATCGEFSMKACNCSGMNSHTKLLAALGVGQSLIPPPTSMITAPAMGATIQNGAAVTVNATSKRGVSKVELWLNGYKWAEAKGAPFTQTGQATGPYQLNIPGEVPNSIIDIVVKAKDDIGAETSSATVTVTKGAACADASTCAAGQKCEAGKCFWDPAVGAVGDVCTYPQYCLSGICLNAGGEDMRCTQTCVPNVGDSCPADFECIAASSTSGVCWPKEEDTGCCSTGREGVAQTSLLGLGLIFVLRRRRAAKR